MDWQDLIHQTLLINKTHGREGLFMSQAFKNRWRVRYSPSCFSSFSFRTRKVSPGEFGTYPSFRSRIWQSSSRGRPCQYRITVAWHQVYYYSGHNNGNVLFRDTTLATIMVTFYSEIAYPLVTVFYWAKHNPKDIFESTIDLYY